MTRALRIEQTNGIYHIMHRGACRRSVYLEDEDYMQFLACLGDIETAYGIQVLTWCLMPNHYHLLIRTPEKNLSKSMQYLNSVYTRRFNKKHGRDGALFRGRFKSIIVDSEEYALQVSRYIHLNPVSADLCSKPENYFWSNYSNFTGLKSELPDFSAQFALQFFGLKPEQYQQFVQSGNSEKVCRFYSKKGISPVFGSDAFRKKITQLIKKKDRLIPEQNHIMNRPSIEHVITTISETFNVSKNSLTKRNRDKQNKQIYRGIAIWTTRWRCGLPHKELIKHFGVMTK